jgi:hypothetical protein
MDENAAELISRLKIADGPKTRYLRSRYGLLTVFQPEKAHKSLLGHFGYYLEELGQPSDGVHISACRWWYQVHYQVWEFSRRLREQNICALNTLARCMQVSGTVYSL